VSKAGITFENFEAGERLASSFENNKDRSFYSSHWPLLLLRHIRSDVYVTRCWEGIASLKCQIRV
jgi:hypothetical protein